MRVEHGLQNDAQGRRGGLRDQNARRQCYPGDAVAHAREIIQPRGGAPVAEADGVVRTAARLGVGQPERRERLDAFIIRAQEPRSVARVNLDRSQRKRAQRGRDRREWPRGGAAGLDVDLEMRRERKSLDGGVETLRQRLDVPPPRRELGLQGSVPAALHKLDHGGFRRGRVGASQPETFRDGEVQRRTTIAFVHEHRPAVEQRRLHDHALRPRHVEVDDGGGRRVERREVPGGKAL